MRSLRVNHRSPVLAAALLLAFCSLSLQVGCSGGGSTSTGGGTPAQPSVITWNTPAPIVYGTALSGTQLNATANNPGTFTYSPAAGAIPTAGTQTLSVSFAPSNTSAYLAANSTVSLSVTKATPVVTWPAPTSITAATALGPAQLNATASVPGTFVYTPAAGTLLPAGTQTLSVTFTPTDSTDYTAVTQTTSITVTTPPPSYTWKSVRIVAGGFITGVVAHPTQRDLRYMRTDIGGAYRWDPTNSIWVPLLDFLSSAQDNYLGVESLALDPTNPQKLYLAVGTYAVESFATNGAFMLSSDQGATFTIVPVPIKMGSNDSGRHAGERLAVDPNQPSTLYFGSRIGGLWKSTNSGAAWAQVASFPVAGLTNGVGISFVDFIPSSGTSGSATPIIYVGVSDSGASTPSYSSLYRSTDGGTTWAAVPAAPTGLFVSHGVLGPDGALYLSYGNGVGPAGITSGALWKYALPSNISPNGAGTWTNISVPAPARPTYSQGGYGAIAVDPQRPGVLMASTMDDYYPGDDIFRSTNYGASWVSLNAQGKTHDYTLSPWITFHKPGSVVGTGNWAGTLLIDPFNSNHVMYGTGQTLWDSTNIQVSDTGAAPAFTIGALGVEEASIGPLLSPTAGANLLSGMGDIDGFVHTNLDVSPALGMIGPAAITQTKSLDFAQNVPLTVVLAGAGGGAIATDGGLTATSWTAFTLPTGSTAAQGTVAISADAATIVWATSDGPVAYSTNKGVSWTASTGAILAGKVYSDRINPLKFYLVSGTTLQISTDGGRTFTNVTTSLPGNTNMTVSPAAEGDLWIAAGSTVRRSTDSGATFSSINGLSSVTLFGFGKAAAGKTYPAIYAIATGSTGAGFYRSTDAGVIWIQINDAAHQFAYTPIIIGDPRIFGRVYIGTNGRGIFYGDSAY